MWTFLRKIGIVGAVFFAANALAVIASLIVLLMRSRQPDVATVGWNAKCPVCGAHAAGSAKYCAACGSRL